MGEPWQRSDATRISDYGGSVILPIGEGDRKRGGGRQSIPSLGLTMRPASSLAHFVEQVAICHGSRGFGF